MPHRVPRLISLPFVALSLAVPPVALAQVSCVLDPGAATNPLDTFHLVTVTVANGGPIADVGVSFQVQPGGPNAGTFSTGITDALGQAEFAYLGSGGPGRDVIAAFGTAGSGTFSCTATKDWVSDAGPTPTPTLVPTPTASPTPTATSTPTLVPTPTASPTPATTPTPTLVPTPTATIQPPPRGVVSARKVAELIDRDGNGTFSEGDELLYRITILNDRDEEFENVVFSDSLPREVRPVAGSVAAPAGATVRKGNGESDRTVVVIIPTLPPGRVEISFKVALRAPDRRFLAAITAGRAEVCNQGSVTGAGRAIFTDDPARPGTEDPTCTAVGRPGGAKLVADKSALAVMDNDRDGKLSAGDHVDYHIRIRNVGGRAAAEVMLLDVLDAGVSLVPGSLQVGDRALPDPDPPDRIDLDLGNPDIFGVDVFFTVRLEATGATEVCNQAEISARDPATGEALPALLTDDTSTEDEGDPTCRVIGNSLCLVPDPRGGSGTHLIATIEGTDEPDQIDGSPGDDVIAARAGNDLVRAGDGDDIVCAGPGNDTVHGGAGADVLIGEAGRDGLYGESGGDSIFGGPGNDFLRGNEGDDRLFGGEDSDHLFGDSGFDSLFGEAGDDRLTDLDEGVLDGGPGRDGCTGKEGVRFIDCETINPKTTPF